MFAELFGFLLFAFAKLIGYLLFGFGLLVILERLRSEIHVESSILMCGITCFLLGLTIIFSCA